MTSITLFKDEEQPPTPAPSPAPFINPRMTSVGASPLSHQAHLDHRQSSASNMDHQDIATSHSHLPIPDIQFQTSVPSDLSSYIKPGSSTDLADLIHGPFDHLSDNDKVNFLKQLLGRSSKHVISSVFHAIDPYLRKDPFRILPNEISLKILALVDDPRTLARCSQVSRVWYLMVSDDYSWKQLCQKHHFRRLSAAVSIDRQQKRQPSVSLDPHLVDPYDDILEAVYNPNVTRRPWPRSYRSHFKQQYLLNSAWATGGRTAARYTIDHGGVVTALVVSDKYIVIALDNSKIFVFREDGKMLRSLFGHVMGVWALAIEGNRLISGGCDRDVRVWDLISGDCLQIMKGHTSTVRCLQMTDERTAVSGSRDTTVRVWDIEQGICKYTLEGHELSVRCVEVANNMAVSGSYDCTAKVWDLTTGTLMHTLTGHFSQIYSLAFDGKRVATGSLDASIRIWDAKTGICLAMLQGHTSLVGQLQMRGDVLVSGGSDGAVRVWDLKEYKCVSRIAAHDNSVTCLQYDEERIVSGGSDGRVRVWNLSDGQYMRDLSMQFEVVWRVAIKNDDIIIVASRGGKAIMEVTSFTPPVEEGRGSISEPLVTPPDAVPHRASGPISSSGPHSPKTEASSSLGVPLDTGVSPLSEEPMDMT